MLFFFFRLMQKYHLVLLLSLLLYSFQRLINFFCRAKKKESKSRIKSTPVSDTWVVQYSSGAHPLAVDHLSKMVIPCMSLDFYNLSFTNTVKLFRRPHQSYEIALSILLGKQFCPIICTAGEAHTGPVTCPARQS